MPIVIYVLLAILGLNIIGNAVVIGQGGADRPKSAGMALLDIFVGVILVVWLLVVFL